MRYLIIAILALSLTSCEKMKNLEKENALLKEQLDIRTAYVDEITQVIDDVQVNLERIEDREEELQRISLGGTEVGNANDLGRIRNRLNTGMAEIDTLLVENRSKMDALDSRIRRSNVKLGGLEKLITSLKASVGSKESEIDSMRFAVNTLGGRVDSLNMVVVNRETALAESDRLIQEKEAELLETIENSREAFFLVGTTDELENIGIVNRRKTGFLKLRRKTEIASLDEGHFRQTDVSTTRLDLGNVSQAKVLSAHKDLDELYAIANTDGVTSLLIRDADRFWDVSRYLVVEVK